MQCQQVNEWVLCMKDGQVDKMELSAYKRKEWKDEEERDDVFYYTHQGLQKQWETAE